MDIAINGKILKFNYCSFQDSLKLIRITTKILKNNVDTLKDILPNIEGINKVEETLKNDLDFTKIINILLAGLEDKELYDIALSMAGVCIYNNEAINQNFFEIPENRGLFAPIMFHILKNNLSIFFSKIKNIQS